MPSDPFARAMLEQSRAIMNLVAHMPSEQVAALFGPGHSSREKEVDLSCGKAHFSAGAENDDGALYGLIPYVARVSAGSHAVGVSDGHHKFSASGKQDLPRRDLLCPVPFPSWIEQLLRQVLAARTKFSFFILQSIRASRSGRNDITATALFPIPFPFEDIFRVGPDSFGKKKRSSRALRKMLHLAVMALNYEHFRNPFSSLSLIRRRPSAAHTAVYNRLWMLCKACGPLDSISLSGCGRKTFQIHARFKELVAALDNLGLNPTSIYHHAAAGREVSEDNDVADELRPYRPLDASRVKLTGTGEWNCEDYLSDLLFMAFVEPAINTFDVIPPEGLYPDVADADCRQIEELCRVWHANGLLRLIPVELRPEPADMHLHTRVFGNFKNKLVDRQIGDRRGRNFVEGRISPGPSHEIPSATALLQLEARRFHEVLVGAIADRRDFYHQFHVTPAFCLGDFKHTAAYSAFVQTFAKQLARPREEVDDFLGMPRPLLIGVSDDRPVYAAFGALFQGDHLGVGFACCAHAQMLEEAGCHCAMNRLCAHHAILHNSPVTGLVIDDFFVVSAEDRPSARGSDFLGKSKSSEVLEQAKAAYKREGIIGSDDKEVQNSLKFKVIGAEVNSCTELVDKGLVSLGAPGDKRLGLCMLSALIANLPYTTDALHASLVGSWISVLLYRRPMMCC